MESWYYRGFDVFTICAKMVYAHVRFPLLAISRHDVVYCLSDVLCLVPIETHGEAHHSANKVSTEKENGKIR